MLYSRSSLSAVVAAPIRPRPERPATRAVPVFPSLRDDRGLSDPPRGSRPQSVLSLFLVRFGARSLIFRQRLQDEIPDRHPPAVGVQAERRPRVPRIRHPAELRPNFCRQAGGDLPEPAVDLLGRQGGPILVRGIGGRPPPKADAAGRDLGLQPPPLPRARGPPGGASCALSRSRLRRRNVPATFLSGCLANARDPPLRPRVRRDARGRPFDLNHEVQHRTHRDDFEKFAAL